MSSLPPPPVPSFGSSPTGDHLTISRALAAEEITAGARALRRTALFPTLWIGMGVAVVVLVLFTGAISDWSVPGMVGVGVVVLVVFGIGIGIGLPLGNALAASRARHEFGPTRTLTVTWDATGMHVAGANLSRTAAYGDVRRVRRRGGTVVLRLRISSLIAPYLVALPADFVPPVALERIAAAGARIG